MRALLSVLLAMTTAAAAQPIAYPPAPRGDTVDTLFGEKVADPYRWLETDVRNDPAVRAWVDAENEVTGAYLRSLPGRAAIAARLKQLWDYEKFGVPRKRGQRYFYTRNDGLQNQAPLYVRDGLDGTPRLLIDPNPWAKDGATALADWQPSEDGTKLAYMIQDGGTDWRTIRVLDVATGKTLADEVRWGKFTPIAWAKDGSGFYYARFAEPAAGATYQAQADNHSVYFHRVGDPQAADRLVFATPDQPKLLHAFGVSDDGRWLVIQSEPGSTKNMLTVLDLARPGAKPVTLIGDLANEWTAIEVVGTRLLVRTDKDAKLGRIVAFDLARPAAAPVTVVAEGKSAMEDASLVGGTLFVDYLVDAKSEVRRFALDGKPLGTVALPGIGSVAGFSGRPGDGETFYSFTSFNVPTTIYRYDVTAGTATVFARPKVAFAPEDYSVEQRFYRSKDGTRVPLFVVHKRGLDLTGGRPTMLYAYGGFNASYPPSFSPANLDWMEMGGVYVLANIRGGGEYGAAWHEAGMKANKQNVFDDFIAAGEYLIAEGIATKDKLVVRGGSNGGLLVGAVVNQRPDLFAAALPQVGVMDMLRFNRFTAGRYWVDDYGDPGRAADFKVLRAYSPYHNVPATGRYPAILATTADTDDRVVPGHSFKYAAALQHADLGPKPRLIRIETRAGHGSGKPTDKIIAEYADMWAFAAKWTGLTPQ